MTTFLFWNIHKKDLTHSIARIVNTHDVNVLILAESRHDDQILDTLNSKKRRFHLAPKLGCDKISIFANAKPKLLPIVIEDPRSCIRHLKFPGCISILLAMAHLSDQRNNDVKDIERECRALSTMIRQAEIKVKHDRTVLVGDFNLNPFSDGIMEPDGLNGVMTRDDAQKGATTVNGRMYPFFYNPMWNFFGDHSPGSPGTYFFNSSRSRNYRWHILDQVLLSPSLLPQFDNDNLEILTSDGQDLLIDTISRRPLVDTYSDHLPLLFKLSL